MVQVGGLLSSKRSWNCSQIPVKKNVEVTWLTCNVMQRHAYSDSRLVEKNRCFFFTFCVTNMCTSVAVGEMTSHVAEACIEMTLVFHALVSLWLLCPEIAAVATLLKHHEAPPITHAYNHDFKASWIPFLHRSPHRQAECIANQTNACYFTCPRRLPTRSYVENASMQGTYIPGTWIF